MGDNVAGPRGAIEVLEDLRWGRSCLAYNVQIPVVGEAAQVFAEAQVRLRALLGTRVRPIPPEALHISVYGVVPVGWESAEKEAVWQRISTAVHALLARCCERAGAFALTFERVRVEPYAVIAVARESNTLIEELRRGLDALVVASGLPRREYAIVHSTLARFSQSWSMASELVAQTDDIPLRATVNVAGVQLVRELVYPSLSLELLASPHVGNSGNCTPP